MWKVGLIKQLQTKWIPNKPYSLIEIRPILHANIIGSAMATRLIIKTNASQFTHYISSVEKCSASVRQAVLLKLTIILT